MTAAEPMRSFPPGGKRRKSTFSCSYLGIMRNLMRNLIGKALTNHALAAIMNKRFVSDRTYADVLELVDRHV